MGLRDASGQLGSDNPTVQQAGVYAMADLAHDWPENRTRASFLVLVR
jgi:hypothetical protein